MKHTATLEDANHSLDEAVSTLQNHLSKVDQNEPEQLKLANEYYKWTTLKTNLILKEKSFFLFSLIPIAFIANFIFDVNVALILAVCCGLCILRVYVRSGGHKWKFF